MNRTKSSIKNAVFTMSGAVITMLLQFVNRRIFINYLTSEYLGLNGLFSNILSMLSLSELGVGAAIIYALYKPVAEKDTEKIKSLMSMYKKFYTLIGGVIIGIGMLLTPFLGIFIKEMPDIPHIRLYYIMYVLDTGLSYFYTYKRSLIICNRENYISSITTTVTSIGTRAAQLLVLIITHNYFWFLLTQIIFNRIENIVISKIADKKYPYLLEKDIKPLDKEEVSQIKKNIYAMLTHKIGNVVVNGTDNIIISKILGLSVLGLYSNYSLPISAVNGIIMKVFQSITSNIGNLVAEKNKEEAEEVFFNIFFANYWIYGFCSVCFFCLLQPFVSLWLGDDYLLPMSTVWILTIVFYLNGVRNTALVFRDAAGVFYHDRYKALIESAVNLLVSIPLTIFLGVTGVKLGTMISLLSTSFWIEGYILYKYYFKKSMKKYYLKQLQYACVFAVASILTNQLCLMIEDNGIFAFCLKGFVCMVVPNVIFCVLFLKTKEFGYYKNMAVRILKKL